MTAFFSSRIVFAVSATLIVLATSGIAIAQKRMSAFSYSDHIIYAPKSVGDPERRYLDINQELLNRNNVSPGDIITIQYEGREFDFRVKKLASYIRDTYTIVATSADRYLYLTVNNGVVIASVQIPEIRYEGIISHDPDLQKSYLQEHNHSAEMTCGAHELGDQLKQNIESHIEGLKFVKSSQYSTLADNQQSQTSITLMILYTNLALSWMESNGGVSNVINQAMAKTQEAHDASNTLISIDLVHHETIAYNEQGTSSIDILKQLTSRDDGQMDHIHALRNTHQADLVALFADVSDLGGIAWILGKTSGDDIAVFSVNKVRIIPSSYVLAHELGHNLGSKHSRNQSVEAALETGGLFPYSTGWRWNGTNGISYASVMTYADFPISGPSSIHVPHFSNPDISYQGVPTGTSASDVPYGPADNARSMREIKDVVAAYRPLQPPLITSVSPTEIERGTQATLVFTGQHFITVNTFGAVCQSPDAISIVSATIDSPTQITMVMNVSANAALGACQIQFSSPVGIGNIFGFTIIETVLTAPTVTTVAVTEIGSTTATAGGDVTDDGKVAVTARGVCYATTENPTTSDQCVASGSGKGAFTANLTGLTQGTLYYVRAYATNTVGTSYGAQVNFTTLTPAAAPTVTTSPVTNIGVTSATTGGDVTDGGSSAVTARGVCYGAAPNPTTSDQCVSSGSGAGAFTASLTGLTQATLYYVRAYATNSVGTSYGAQVSFTTQNPFVNKRPTMNVIGDVSILHTAAEQVVNLTGISAGAGENQNVTVTAVAANTQLIPSLSVQYVSPQATGTLRFQNDRRQVGTTTISVTVKDDAGTANGGVDSLVVSFLVNVLLDTDLGEDETTPSEFRLDQNYPNPFNPSTQISYSLPTGEHVDLAVYDMMGRRVTQLVDAFTAAGTYRVTFDAGALPSGIYMYVIKAGSMTASNKMTLIK